MFECQICVQTIVGTFSLFYCNSIRVEPHSSSKVHTMGIHNAAISSRGNSWTAIKLRLMAADGSKRAKGQNTIYTCNLFSKQDAWYLESSPHADFHALLTQTRLDRLSSPIKSLMNRRKPYAYILQHHSCCVVHLNSSSVRSTTVPSSSTLRNLLERYIPRNFSMLTSPGKILDSGSSV